MQKNGLLLSEACALENSRCCEFVSGNQGEESMKCKGKNYSLRGFHFGLLLLTSMLLVILLAGCGGSQGQRCDGVTAVPTLHQSMVVNHLYANITNTSAEPRLVTLVWREPGGNSQSIQPIRVDARDSVEVHLGALQKRYGNTIHELSRNGYELAISECH